MKKEKLSAGNILVVVMGVLYAVVTAVLFSHVNSLPKVSWIFHLSTEFFCMTSLLVICVWHLRNEKKEDSVRMEYSELCLILFLAICVDIFSWVIDGRPKFALLARAANTVVYLLLFFHGAKFVAFAFSFAKEGNERLESLKNGIVRLMGILFVFWVIILLGGGFFTIDASGYCENKPTIVAGYIAIALVVVFVCGIVAGTGISTRKILQILSYPAGILGMLLIATIDAGYANGLIGVTLSMIYIYFSMTLDAAEGKESLGRNFRRYLSDDVVEHLTTGREALKLGGTTQYVSIVFCQLHRFGKITESMDPRKVVQILNDFYTVMLDVVTVNGGTLLEFPGYGIFCIFGAYEKDSDHASVAVKTAAQMQNCMETINKENLKKGFPEIGIGIGINTGDVVLGNIGSRNHMRYTAISRNVNLASRIETYAEDGDILVSQSTLDNSSNILESRKICTVIPKGVANPIDVYKVEKIKQ